MNRVTIIYGSPRKKGNSATLARKVKDGLSEMGITPEEFYLHGTDMAPCSACDGCQKSAKYACVVEDDLRPVLESVANCDYLVLAGPIYNFNVSAQLKIFLDRSYSLWKPTGSILKGKKVAIILTYADEDPKSSGVFNAIAALQDGYRFVEAPVLKVLHFTASGEGDILNNKAALDEAHDLGILIGKNQLKA